MDTLEGNKLIALFDGWKILDLPKNGDIVWVNENYSTKITDDLYLPSRPDSFKYHLSWDWLMPVIEKIEDIDIRNNGYDFPKVKFLGDNVEIFAYATYRGTAYYWKKWYTIGGKWVCHTNQATTKIEAAWLAVVEFIRWYNPQKQ